MVAANKDAEWAPSVASSRHTRAPKEGQLMATVTGMSVFHQGGFVEVHMGGAILIFTRDEYDKAVRRGRSVVINRSRIIEEGRWGNNVPTEP